MVGGFAVSARSRPRFTGDIDIAVALDEPDQAESVGLALRQRGYEVVTIVEQESAGQRATIRMVPPVADGAEVLVDLLFASSGVESEVVAGATETVIAGDLSVPVAIAPDLLALKVLSVSDERPIDVADIQALLAVCGPAELDRTRALLALIEERGYERGRKLLPALQEYVSRFSKGRGE